MKPIHFSSIALAAVLVVGACSDATQDPITGPSLRRGRGIVLTTTECTGVLPPGTYGNIVVPAGASCTINGSVVRGSIFALADSRLFMSADQVTGYIKGEGADIVQIVGTTIEDEIYLVNGTLSGGGGHLNVLIANGTIVRGGDIYVANFDADIIAVFNVTVTNGSIKLEDNVTESFLQTDINTVSGSVEILRNGGAGPKFVATNTAGVAVRCFDNTGAFFAGGPNFAPVRQGQCF